MQLTVVACCKVVAVSTLVKSCLVSLALTLGVTSFTALGEAYDASALTAQQAFENGRLLRAQFKNVESRPFLKHAADSGNADAAYLYAMELSNYKTTIRTPQEARDYLLQAAQGGNRHAMQHLYLNGQWLSKKDRLDWQQKYHDALIRLGRTAPAQALFELAQYYHARDKALSEYYLTKAAAFRHPRALMEQARRIERGAGTYVMPGERETVVRKTYLAAAETGYVPAIRAYINLLEDKGRYKEAFDWRRKALQAGDLTSLAALGFIYSGQSEGYPFIETDLVLAKAYLDLYMEMAGTDRLETLYSTVAESYQQITPRINAEQEKAADKIESSLKNSVDFYNHDLFWDI